MTTVAASSGLRLPFPFGGDGADSANARLVASFHPLSPFSREIGIKEISRSPPPSSSQVKGTDDQSCYRGGQDEREKNPRGNHCHYKDGHLRLVHPFPDRGGAGGKTAAVFNSARLVRGSSRSSFCNVFHRYLRIQNPHCAAIKRV
jgi:hypothetical protein